MNTIIRWARTAMQRVVFASLAVLVLVLNLAKGLIYTLFFLCFALAGDTKEANSILDETIRGYE